jgi:hypothetical protein
MDFAKLTVDEFKSLLRPDNRILNIRLIDEKPIHVSDSWILDQIAKQNWKELDYLSIPTYYMHFNTPEAVYGISGRWVYAYQDGYFVRIKSYGRCS